MGQGAGSRGRRKCNQAPFKLWVNWIQQRVQPPTVVVRHRRRRRRAELPDQRAHVVVVVIPVSTYHTPADGVRQRVAVQVGM